MKTVELIARIEALEKQQQQLLHKVEYIAVHLGLVKSTDPRTDVGMGAMPSSTKTNFL